MEVKFRSPKQYFTDRAAALPNTNNIHLSNSADTFHSVVHFAELCSCTLVVGSPDRHQQDLEFNMTILPPTCVLCCIHRPKLHGLVKDLGTDSIREILLAAQARHATGEDVVQDSNGLLRTLGGVFLKLCATRQSESSITVNTLVVADAICVL